MVNIEKNFDVICVGDCVMDCLFYVNRMPKLGETMAANSFECLPGGKGANTVIASARLGSKNSLISKLGNDLFGKNFIEILKQDNINTDNVSFTEEAPTSVASIMVDLDGNNSPVVNFGATLKINEKDIDNAEEKIKNSKVLICSMMIDKFTVLHALKLAKKHKLITILNYSPAVNFNQSEFEKDFNQLVDVLVVNEVETEAMSGFKIISIDDAKKACNFILSKNIFSIGCVVTLGEKGCVFGDSKKDSVKYFLCPKVNVVDTTGAGDAFLGSLAHYLCHTELELIGNAIQLSVEYASISVETKGTQASYPFIEKLDKKFKLVQ